MTTPMRKSSTLIYLFSNFDDSELIPDDLLYNELERLDDMFEFIDKNTRKVPGHILDHVFSFAKEYM